MTSRRRARRRRLRALDLERPGAVVVAADALGLDLLLAWIVDGPDRPPEDAAELLRWSAAR